MAAPLPTDLNEVDSHDAWKPWLPAKNEWSRKWAAHLFRRAAFGAKPAEIDRALADGFPKTLERLLVGAPDADKLLDLFTEVGQYCKDAANLRIWWLRFMVEGGHPLREKLTLFWHNHFATSIAKVREINAMFEQNITLRKHALGKFPSFLLEMSKNPAMLVWLDSNQNVKEAPNENYARELMELFSLGVGNYTEKDIREAARSFTGWHTNSAPNRESFEYNPTEHDEGLKTVFGRTGKWDGADIVRLCCDQPACAKFLVGKLYTFLVSETPPPKGLLTPLEDRFRKSDYDIADLVKTMLGSRLFFSTHAYRKRVKWPVEYAIEAVRSVIPGRMHVSKLTDPLAGMGQVLFAPPNVKGWRTGTDWLNSATLLARNNFAETIAIEDRIPSPPSPIPTAQVDPTAATPATGSPLPTTATPVIGSPLPTTATPVIGSPLPTTATPVIGSPLPTAATPATGSFSPTAATPATDTVPLNSDPIIHLPTGRQSSSLAGFLGASRLSDDPSSAEVDLDPITTLYATKPKTVSALVQRMGELLYGERIAAAQVARIERFLQEPMTSLNSATPSYPTSPQPLRNLLSPTPATNPPSPQPYIPEQPQPEPRLLSPQPSTPLSGTPFPKPSTPQLPGTPLFTSPIPKDVSPRLAPPPREVPEKPKSAVEFGFDSPEFKARLREALHAMMCMPEYQLN